MKALGMIVLALTCSVGPALAGKVYVNYDPEYDAGKIRSFAWKDSEDNTVAAANPLLHSRIVNGIEYYLSLAGWQEDDKAPSVYVTYHASTEKEVVLDTSHYGYGYPGAWPYYGAAYPYGAYGASSTTTVRTYEKGTLIVDVWDAATNKLVWRGTAPDITLTDDPEKMGKKIDKALKSMVDRWREIKKNAAKR